MRTDNATNPWLWIGVGGGAIAAAMVVAWLLLSPGPPPEGVDMVDGSTTVGQKFRVTSYGFRV